MKALIPNVISKLLRMLSWRRLPTEAIFGLAVNLLFSEVEDKYVGWDLYSQKFQDYTVKKGDKNKPLEIK